MKECPTTNERLTWRTGEIRWERNPVLRYALISYHDLKDGELFSTDGGTTWYICAMPLFGNIAIYVDQARTGRAPTIRVDAPVDGQVTIIERN